jgi:hypothetical protein
MTNADGNGLPIALELVLAILITPILTYLIFFFQAKRQKDDRFDELRHQTYVNFTHRIIEALRQRNHEKAGELLSQAWLYYESILLSSEYSVICSCWDIRIAVERYISALSSSETNQEALLGLKDSAWSELHVFHVLARRELGLGNLKVEQIKSQQARYLTSLASDSQLP